MLNTRTMSNMELYKAADVPLNCLAPSDAQDVFKAARVFERRRNDWLKQNPDKTADDWYDTWYPGGHKAYYKILFSMYAKV